MASSTPMKDALSIKLSYKLGAGVSTATADGSNGISATLRNDYLTRAYGRLMRILGSYVKSIAEIFPSMYKIVHTADLKKADGTTSLAMSTIIADGGIDIPVNNLSAIEEIYVAVKKTSDSSVRWVNCSKIFPENYMASKYGGSAKYKPSSVQGSEVFYYSIINGKVLFIFNETGTEYTLTGYTLDGVEIFVKNDTSEISSGAKDIIIPSQYHDLLLTLAALEAMYDQGDQVSLNKAQIYSNDIDRQVNILRDVRQMEIAGTDLDKQRGE